MSATPFLQQQQNDILKEEVIREWFGERRKCPEENDEALWKIESYTKRVPVCNSNCDNNLSFLMSDKKPDGNSGALLKELRFHTNGPRFAMLFMT